MLLASLAVTPYAQASGSIEIPPGWWTLREGEMTTCLESLPDHKLRLTFQTKQDRHPIVVDGSYRLTAHKMSDFHATLRVDRVWQKQLGSCRKAWHDVSLPSTTQLGRGMKAGDELKLTLHFECAGGKPQVQLCLHDDKVVCRALQDPNGTCSEGPAIDGSKINAPARPPR